MPYFTKDATITFSPVKHMRIFVVVVFVFGGFFELFFFFCQGIIHPVYAYEFQGFLSHVA